MDSDFRGNYKLARINEHPRDRRIVFDEPSHKYTVDGKTVSLSVTGLWSAYFDKFNALGTIIRSHKKWASGGKYAMLIAYMHLVEGKTDDDVVQGIADYWNANGRRASDIGTEMHAMCEQIANDAPYSTETPRTIEYLVGPSPSHGGCGGAGDEDMQQLSMYLNIVHKLDLDEQLAAFSDLLCRLRAAADASVVEDEKTRQLRSNQALMLECRMTDGFRHPYVMTSLDVELSQYRAFESDFLEKHNLEPFRTEWSVFHEEADLAGQIDGLFRQRDTGEFWMIDYKRCNPAKGLLSPEMTAFGDRRGKGPCSVLPDTSYGHYCVQQNLYTRLLETKYDMRISRMYLAQFHCDLGEGVFHMCPVEYMPDLSDELIARRIASLSEQQSS